MKYLEKSFSVVYGSENYRNNFDKVFNVQNNTTEVEVDLSEEVIEYIEKYAKDHSLTFNDAACVLLEEGLKLMEKDEDCEKGE